MTNGVCLGLIAIAPSGLVLRHCITTGRCPALLLLPLWGIPFGMLFNGLGDIAEWWWWPCKGSIRPRQRPNLDYGEADVWQRS